MTQKLLAASLLLLASAPALTSVRAYAQVFDQPATVNTVPHSVSLDTTTSSAVSVAGIGAGSTQGILVTTTEMIPKGTSTDSQSGTGANAPTVPQAPGTPQVDVVSGLIPAVAAVTLTPDVPVLPTANTHSTTSSTVANAAPVTDSTTNNPINPVGTSAHSGTVTVTTAPSTSSQDSSATATAPVSATPHSSTVSAAPVAPNADTSGSIPSAPVAAQTVVTTPTTPSAHITLTNGTVFGTGLGLDLSSSQTTIAAPVDQPVNIVVGGTIGANGIVTGGTTVTIAPGQMITASQYVALTQVVENGSQSIVITATGAADGGSFSLLAGQTGTLSSLVLPTNVTLGGIGFTDANPFTVSGSASILGSFFSLQTNSSSSSILNFGNLTVSGLLSGDSSQLISSGPFHIPSGLFSSSALTLNTVGSLQNFGTISSAGILNINAGSDFTNSGIINAATALNINTPQIFNLSVGNQAASILAGQSVNLNIAQLVNSGNIASMLGDINASSKASLSVENSGGALKATNGTINLVSNNDTLRVMGGNFDAPSLNLKAGHSIVELQADAVSGVVNASADNVHLYTSQSDLRLGNIDASGDPTLASQANIIIDGTIAPTNGANLAIVAGGNILSGVGGQLDTRVLTPAGGNGGNLSLIAGANFTVDGGGNVVLTDSANAGKGSITGGFIDLTGNNGGTGPITTITTAGTGATGNAGYVQLVAYSGTGTGNGIGSGSIMLPTTVSIDASAANGNRGDVSIISGGTVQTGSITANKVSISTFTPTVGSGMFFDGTGTASNGINSFATSGTVKNTVVQIIGNTSATNDVSISSGTVSINGNISANGAGGQSGASLDGGDGHNININAVLGVIMQGSLSAVGGGGAGSGSATSTMDGGKGGNGGQVTLTTTQALSQAININGGINVSGGGGGGGAGSSETTAATNGGAGGVAGLVKISSAGGVIISGKILEHDGGAGGAGANVIGGVGGGGGGGSAYGGGGGGGGGGTGNIATEFASGGGGGFSAASGSGGGGGGVYGSVGLGTLSTGGNGGSATANGNGGLGDVVGTTGLASVGGTGGGITSPGAGGAGGTALTIGGSGGSTNIVGQGLASAGTGSRVVTGHGLLDMTGGYGVNSSLSPLQIESGALKVSATAPFQVQPNFNFVDTAGVPLNLISVTLPTSSTFRLTTSQNAGTTGADGTVNVLGNVSAGKVFITTNGDAGPNNININASLGGVSSTGGPSGPSFAEANLVSNGGTITTFGSGVVTAAGGTISATGDINLNTNAGTASNNPLSLGITSTNGNVLVNQSALVLNLGPSGAKAGGSFAVNAKGAINVIGPVTVDGGNISLATTTGNSGILAGAAISTGNTTGSITLSTSGTGAITGRQGSTTAVLTSNAVNLLTNSSIGSALAPVLTNAVNNGTVQAISGTAGNVYLSDSNSGIVTINAPTTSTGTLSIVSKASQLNVPQADYSTVSITNNGSVGNVLLNSSNNASAVLGNGSGAFTVAATGNIDANASTQGIKGTTSSFTSTNGSIGSAGRIKAGGTTLTVNAANGSVDVETAQATTINATASNNLSIIDTASGPIAINGLLASNTVLVQAANASNVAFNSSVGKASAANVDVTSGGSITFTPGSSVTAQDINLNSATNAINFGSMTSDSLHLATNVGAVSILSSAAPGGTEQITAGGDLTVLNSFNSSNAVNVATGGNLTVGSAANHTASIAGSTLAVTGQSVTNYGTLAGTNAITFDTSTANGQIANSGSITGSGMQLLAGTGNVSNSAGASISSTDTLSLQAANINNSGNISTQSLLSIANPSGDLSITGTNGGFTTGSGATLSLQSPGNITVGGGASDPFSGLNQLGNFTLAAGGTFTSPLNSIALVADGTGNGGTIDISASNIVYNGSATRTTPFLLSADGGNSAGNHGGLVNLNLFGTAASGLTVGNNVGNYKISAVGADGGTVNVSTPGNLTVNTAQLLANSTGDGAGSTLSLTSGKNLLISGNLDTHNGAGGYGAINLSTGSTQAFTIDGTKSATTNGQIGISSNQGISGSSVTINNAAGVVLANNNVLAGTNALTINGSGLTNNGKVNTANLTINASGNGNLTTGSTGVYQNQPLQSLALSSQTGNFSLNGKAPSANVISVTANNGTVAFGNNISALNAAPDASGNGGTINIAAKNITSSGIAFNAAGTTGNGGSVALNLTGTNALKIEEGVVSINAANAAGMAGGTVSVTNGGNISVDARYLNVGSNYAADQGANLTLASGGKLYLDHTSKLPSTINNLTLASNSSSAFVLGGASSSGNGIGDDNRVLEATNIVISNTGAGITRGDNSSLKGSTVSLAALGSIGQANTPLVVNTPSLNLSSTNGSAYVNLRTAPSTNFVANVAGALKLDSTGSINTDQTVSATSLDLNAAGVNIGSTLVTNAASITARSTVGDMNIYDTRTSLAELGEITVQSGGLSLASGGALKANGAISAYSGVGLTAGGDGDLTVGSTIASNIGTVGLTTSGNGSITTKATLSTQDLISIATGGSGNISLGGAVNSLNSVSLNTGGAGSISQGNGSYNIKTTGLSINAGGGNVGGATAPLRTQVQTLSLNSSNGGDFNIANKNTIASGITQFAGFNQVGSLKFVETNTTNNNTGSLLVNSIVATTGAISISSNERNLTVTPSSVIATTDGNITLQNTYSKNGSNLPSIQIGDNVHIHGSSFGSTDTGNVYIVLGPIPSNADLRPGIAPTSGSPDIAGTVYFGTKSNPNGSITTGTGNALYGLDRNLVFNTNKLAASQITLGDNVVVIADPPLPVGGTVADFGALQYAANPVSLVESNAVQTTAAELASIPLTSPLPNLPFSSPLSNSDSLTSNTASQALVANLTNDYIGGSRTYASKFDQTEIKRLSGEQISASQYSEGANLSIDQGNVLFAPDKTITVKTQSGLVNIPANSIVFIMANGPEVAIYDLHQTKQNAVQVVSEKKLITLEPGRLVVLTSQATRDFERIVSPSRNIGYRNPKQEDLSESIKVFAMDYSIPSLIANVAPLRKMLEEQTGADKVAMDKILKNSALLMELTASAGPFKDGSQ